VFSSVDSLFFTRSIIVMSVAIDGKTVVYGIIGNPVSHSLSPAMHNSAFKELAINGVYVPFNVENVQEAVPGLRSLGVKGVSVTIPHKETVIPLLDKVDDVAASIGAVNTLHVEQGTNGNLLCGSNTDWVGANMALSQSIELKGADVVLLGAGGSARAIGFGLLEAGAKVILCSRTERRGRALAADLKCSWVSLSDAEYLKADALVNATSVGMNEDVSPLQKRNLKNFSVVMDIVYAPLQTTLLRYAEACGCKTIKGLEMLLYQGVAQFELWTGKSAPVEVMRAALEEMTANNIK
jgi:shikimate dehydrogenase